MQAQIQNPQQQQHNSTLLPTQMVSMPQQQPPLGVVTSPQALSPASTPPIRPQNLQLLTPQQLPSSTGIMQSLLWCFGRSRITHFGRPGCLSAPAHSVLLFFIVHYRTQLISKTLRNLLLLFLHKVLHHLQHVQLHTYLVCTEKLINIW